MKRTIVITCMLLAGPLTAQETPFSGLGVGSTGQHPAKGIVTSFCDYPKDMVAPRGKKGKPVEFSFKRGEKKNILWRCTLPHWGNNAPVKVKDKVFLLCNQGWTSDAPLLVCIDDKNGKILWEKPVDHLDAKGVPPEAKPARAKEIARYKEAMKWWNHCYYNNEKGTWANHTPESFAPKRAEAEKAGWIILKHTWKVGVSGGGRDRWGINAKKGGAPKDRSLIDNFHTCKVKGWHRYQGWGTEQPWYGSTHGSVASDGETIYAITGLGGAAAYDLDGNRKWVNWLKVTAPMEGGCDKWSTRSLASPALAGDTLVFWYWNAPAVYGLDTKTGRIKWKTMAPGNPPTGLEKKGSRKGQPVMRNPTDFERFGGHHGPASTMAIVEVGSEYLAVAGHGMVVRVRDGKFLGWIPGGGRFYYSIAAQGDTVYLPVPHTALSHRISAVRLSLDGDKLKHKVLWTTPDGRDNMARSDGPNLVVDGNRLYMAKTIIDTATGKIAGSLKAGSSKYSVNRATSDKYIISRTGNWTNKHYMTFQVSDKQSGALVGEGMLGEPPAEGEIKDRHIAFLGFPEIAWGCTAMSAWGDRIYIRSNDYLWCIGK